MDCPRCQLPREHDAWQCDGCGHVFDADLAAVRVRLQARLRGAWIELAVAIALTVGVLLGLVLLARRSMLYVSVGLLVAVVGGIGHAGFTIQRVREHLRELERRHAPLPTATVRPPAGSG